MRTSTRDRSDDQTRVETNCRERAWSVGTDAPIRDTCYRCRSTVRVSTDIRRARFIGPR